MVARHVATATGGLTDSQKTQPEDPILKTEDARRKAQDKTVQPVRRGTKVAKFNTNKRSMNAACHRLTIFSRWAGEGRKGGVAAPYPYMQHRLLYLLACRQACVARLSLF